jgi:hypothetical protein
MESFSSSGERPRGLPLGMRPGDPPAFHRLGEYVFQDLCRDLLDTDDDVSYCEVYGVRGQRQYGVDLLAPRRQDKGYDVAQCKAYETFSPAQIRAASDEFVEYQDFWAARDIRRFHLYVACELSSRQCQDEIVAQRERFSHLGIEYDAWSASRIRNRLRLHPEIVRTYLPEGWVRELCGEGVSINAPLSPSAPASRSYADAAAAALLDRLADEASSSIRQRIEELRDAWRAGRKTEARIGVVAIRSDGALWGVLSTAAQSHVLKFEASLAADEADTHQARVLLNEARRIAPQQDYRRLEAIIAYRDGLVDESLERLSSGDSIEDHNLAVGILLDVGRTREAHERITVALEAADSNAETYRLHALILLLQKKVDQAYLAAQNSREFAPHWLATRHTAALINYATSLSPAALPTELRALPSPVPASLVRRDDQTVGRLRAAASEFASLAARADLDDSERIALETHRLACLANDAERQEEAIAYCADLLERDPGHAGAVAWAVGRQFPMDAARVESALRARIESSGDPQPVITLVAALLRWERAADAQDLLIRSKPHFEAAEAVSVWAFWDFQVRIALAENRPDAMTRVSIPDSMEGAQLLVLRAQAETMGTWDAFVAALEDEWARTEDYLVLFDLCRARVRQGEWTFAADHAEQLVSGILTPEALHFAVAAAVNTGRLTLALTLLDKNGALFPHAQLPRELRTVRVRVLQQLGDLSAAVVEAQALVQDQPELEHQMQLARLLFAKGDLAGLSRVAEELADREDLDVVTALQLAHSVGPDNQPLAIRLWRRAVSRPIADDHLAAAVGLGFRLGLDSEMRPLMAALHAAAGRGTASVQLIDAASLPEMMREWNKTAAHVERLYQRGEVPIHLIAERMNIPLAQFYHQILSRNERSANPRPYAPVSIRHGMRGTPTNLPNPMGARLINAEVTALLLAEHLGILDDVERGYSPIRVTAETIPALVQMREAYTSGQPTRDSACREIIELRNSGQLSEAPEPSTVEEELAAEIGAQAAGLARAAIDRNGYVVDYLPLRRSLGDLPVDPPVAVREYFVNARAVIHALHSGGPLSEAEYNQILEKLGTEGECPSLYADPPLRSTLVLAGNVPELLSSAGVLPLVCRHFRVYAERQELERAEQALEAVDQRRQQQEWIDRLIDRLRAGLDSQRYQVLPVSPASIEADDHEDARGPLLSGLLQLLRFPAEESDVIWVDDRFITSFWTRDQVPIFGTLELLQDMVERGVISPGHRFELLLRLRAGQARFIALDAAEILHHLRAARVRQGDVLETEALLILRRSTASVLLDSASWLQPPLLPDGANNPRSEIQLLVAMNRAVVEAILAVWDEPSALAVERRARADWLLENLMLDFAAVRKVCEIANPGEHPLGLVAAHMGTLVAMGARIGIGDGDEGRIRRQAYFAWLSERVLDARFDADPEVVAIAATHLKKSLFSLLQPADDNRVEAIATALLFQQVFEDLPDRIHDEIAADPVIMSALRLHTSSTVEVGRYVFEHSDFVRAAGVAINGGSQSVNRFGGDEAVRFESVPGSALGSVRLIGSGKDEQSIVAAPVLALLSDSVSARERILREHPEWFDGPSPDFDDWVARIATLDDPEERLATAERWQKDSASLYYDNLQRRIRAGEKLEYSDLLPPSSESMLRHYRLSSRPAAGRLIQARLNDAADELAGFGGLRLAIRPWWGLPVEVPERVVTRLESKSVDERRAELRALVRLPASPVSELHILRLLWKFRHDDPAYTRLVRRRALRYLTNAAEAGLTAFRKLLQWLEVEFARRAEYLDWPPHLRLAILWLHADRVYSAFAAAGADPLRLAQALEEADQRLTSRFVTEHPEYASDISNPNALSSALLVVTGFAYVFGDTRRAEIPRVVTERISKMAFVGDGEGKLPAPALLRQLRPGDDLLNSFLAHRGSRRLVSLLGRKDSMRLRPEELGELAEALVHTLEEEHEHMAAWVTLWNLIGRQEPDPSLAVRIARIIQETEFGNLVKADTQNGGVALQAAAALATSIQDVESLAHVREHSIRIAGRLGSEFVGPHSGLFGENSPVPVARWLLEVAVELARRSPDPNAALTKLADHLAELVVVWPEFGRALFPFVRRAMDELRIDEAYFFARLVVLCRVS